MKLAKTTLRQKIGKFFGGETDKRLPTSVLGRLSGWGEAPAMGHAATMASIQAAMKNSENGDTYLLFGLFRDMICNSSHVRGEIAKRLIAVLGKPLVIQPEDRTKEDDKVAAKLCAEMVSNCDNWLDGMLHVQMASCWPVSGAEKIFEPVNGSDSDKFSLPVIYRLKKIVPVNYALFCYRVAYWSLSQASMGSYPMSPGMNLAGPGYRPQLAGQVADENNDVLYWNADDWQPDIRFYSVLPNGQINWDLGATYKPDLDRHIIHRGNIVSSFRDTYGGDLRATLFWWLVATLGRDWFSAYMFRFGRPFILGKANTADENVVNYLKKVFNDGTSVSGGAVIVNKDAEIELVQAAVSGGADGFEKYINLCNKQITTQILGHSLSTSSEKTGLGSGMADVSSDLKDEWREFDNARLKETAVKQIFTPWLRVNGYKGNVIPCWGGASTATRSTLAKTLLDLKNAGWMPSEDSEQAISDVMGFKVERVEIESETNENPANGEGKKPDSSGDSGKA